MKRVFPALFLTFLVLPGESSLSQTAIPKPPAVTQRSTDNLGFPCDFLNLKPGCKYVPAQGSASPKAMDIFQSLATVAVADLEYAKALTVSSGTPAARMRGLCYDALISANKQLIGVDVGIPAPEGSHVVTDAEKLAQLIDNLDLKGPLFVGCSGAAQLFKLTVLQLISGLVTGATGLAALGVT